VKWAGRPATPELRAHQGETPLAHVRLLERRDGDLGEDGNTIEAGPTQSFAFAAFADGTVAFEDLRCTVPGPVTIRRLEPARLANLRAYLTVRCPPLARYEPHWCSHSGTLEVSCVSGKKRSSALDECEGGRGEKPLIDLANELAQQVGAADLIGPRVPCPKGEHAHGDFFEEIDLTVNPERPNRHWYSGGP
jgi:hypothetical protein